MVKHGGHRVDAPCMRLRWLAATTVVVVLIALSTVAASAATARAGATRPTAVSLSESKRPARPPRCVLPRPTHPKSSPSGAGDSPSPVSGPRDGSAQGDLVVSVPPVVFIRERPHRIVITTNTGVPPQPQDLFYVVGSHRARPADAALRAQVLAGCTAWT